MRYLHRPDTRRAATTIAIVAACAAIATRACTRRPADPDTATRPATAEAWARTIAERDAELRAVRGERDGLLGHLALARARLRGLEERRAQVEVVYDTIIVVDTAYLPGTRIDGDGTLIALRALPDSGGHRPRRAEIDVSDCDDGVTLTAHGIVCDRAVLGHLEVMAEVAGSYSLDPLRPGLSASARAGLLWRPAYRSPASIDLAITSDRRVELRLRRGLSLF